MHQPRLASSRIAARADRAWEQRAHNTKADRGTVCPSLHKRTKRTRCWHMWASPPLASSRMHERAAHDRAWDSGAPLVRGQLQAPPAHPLWVQQPDPSPQTYSKAHDHAGYVYHMACMSMAPRDACSQQTTTTTTNYPQHWSTLLIVRSRGQRRKGQSRLSHAWAEERPGRMRHGRRGRALNMDGHQSRPPHHKLSLPLASMRRGVAGTIKKLTCGVPKASPPLTPPTAMR